MWNSRIYFPELEEMYAIIKSGGKQYKVTVGQLDDRAGARLLKSKLSENVKLEGFIVKRDIG